MMYFAGAALRVNSLRGPVPSCSATSPVERRLIASDRALTRAGAKDSRRLWSATPIGGETAGPAVTANSKRQPGQVQSSPLRELSTPQGRSHFGHLSRIMDGNYRALMDNTLTRSISEAADGNPRSRFGLV